MQGERIEICEGFGITVTSVEMCEYESGSMFIEFAVDCPSVPHEEGKPPFGLAIVDLEGDGFNIEGVGGVDIFSTDMDWEEDGTPIPTPWGITDLQPAIARKLTEKLRHDWAEEFREMRRG